MEQFLTFLDGRWGTFLIILGIAIINVMLWALLAAVGRRLHRWCLDYMPIEVYAGLVTMSGITFIVGVGAFAMYLYLLPRLS